MNKEVVAWEPSHCTSCTCLLFPPMQVLQWNSRVFYSTIDRERAAKRLARNILIRINHFKIGSNHWQKQALQLRIIKQFLRRTIQLSQTVNELFLREVEALRLNPGCLWSVAARQKELEWFRRLPFAQFTGEFKSQKCAHTVPIER